MQDVINISEAVETKSEEIVVSFGPRCSADEMETRFPSNIKSEADQAEMAYWCPDELYDWRKAVTAHYRISNIDKRMKNFPVKAAAYDRLMRAFKAAISQAA